MITPEQLKARKQHIGASDMASLYNISPFKSAYSVWCEKVYPMKDTDPTEAMETGNELESPIVNWISKKLELEVDTNPDKLYCEYKDDPLFACNLDALVLNYPTAVEAKYSGNEDDWNECDNKSEKDIPALYYIQCQHQMLCSGFQYIILAVWLSGFHGFEKRYYMVQRDEERIAKMLLIGRKWWNKHVIPAREAEFPEKFMPPSRKPLRNLEIFKRIERVPGKINKIDFETYLAWTNTKRHLKKAKAEEKAAKEIFYKEFGDAKSVQVSGGGPVLSFMDERGRKNIDFDKLRMKYPEIYKELVKQGSRTTLREVKVG